MLVAFSVAPSATDDPDGSVSEAVAAAIRVVRESGIPNRTDSMFTTIEGEWDEVMGVIKACVDRLAETAPRVSLVGRKCQFWCPWDPLPLRASVFTNF